MLSADELEHLRAHLVRTLKVPVYDTRIRAITVNPMSRHQPKMRIEVGRHYANLEPDAPPEEVVAIMESKLYLVITPTRGYFQGMPYLFMRPDVRGVELADE
jgi:hypothetical protein